MNRRILQYVALCVFVLVHAASYGEPSDVAVPRQWVNYVEELRAGLRSEHDERVLTAVDGLGELGELATRAVPDLIELCDHGTGDGRLRYGYAIDTALGRIGDTSAQEHLLDGLRTDDRRGHVVKALAQAGDERAVVPILEWAHTFDSSGGYVVAQKALADLDFRGIRVSDEIYSALASSESAPALGAIGVLRSARWSQQDEKSLPIRSWSSQASVRWEALLLNVLERERVEFESGALNLADAWDLMAVRRKAREYLKSPDSDVRFAAWACYAPVADSKDLAQVDDLLAGDSPLEFYLGIAVLGRVGMSAAEDRLLAILHRPSQFPLLAAKPEVAKNAQEIALQWLPEFESDRALKTVLTFIASDNRSLRRAAYESLSRMQLDEAKETFARLDHAAHDAHYSRRYLEAVRDGGEARNRYVLDVLGNLSDRERSIAMQIATQDAMFSPEIFASYLDDPDRSVARLALSYLAKRREPVALEYFREYLLEFYRLQNDSWFEGPKYLEHFGGAEIVDLLIDHIDESTPHDFGPNSSMPEQLRMMVESLPGLTGRDFGPASDVWIMWWRENREAWIASSEKSR